MRGLSFAFVLLLCSACATSGNRAPADSRGASPEPGGAPPRPEAAPECQLPELFGPAIVPDAVYRSRIGASATRFSQLDPDAARPLEECGLGAVIERLATLECDDGSQPFGGDLRAAHGSRTASLGPGGRCGSILDHYAVPCPERTYDVHADMYICTEANADSWM